MTYLEQAIKDAVEKGGYKTELDTHGHSEHHQFCWGSLLDRKESILLDAAFWQALGRARGWDESYFHQEANGCDYQLFEAATEAWKMNWHRLIDHLASGKDVESFFETL